MRTLAALAVTALGILFTLPAIACGPPKTPEQRAAERASPLPGSIRVAPLALDGPASEGSVGRAVSLAVAECLLDSPHTELVSIVDTERAVFEEGQANALRFDPEFVVTRTGAHFVIIGTWKRDGKGGIAAQVRRTPKGPPRGNAIETAGAYPAAVGQAIGGWAISTVGRDATCAPLDPGALEQAAQGVNLIFGTGMKRDVKAGLRALETAATLDAGFTLARLLAAEVYIMAGKPARAVALLDRSARSEPHAAELLGRAYEQAGQLDRARQAYTTSLKHEARRCTPRVALGDLIAGAGESVEAEKQYQLAIENDTFCDVAKFSLGLLKHRQGDVKGALQWYSKAVRGLPGNPDVHYYRGLALASSDKLEDAVAAFRQTLQLVPTHHDAQRNLGVALLKLGKQQQAIEAFRAYLKTAPPDDPHADKVRQQLTALGGT